MSNDNGWGVAMTDDSRAFWQKASRVFDERAEEYDSWYDDSLLFAIELATLQDLQTTFATPRVEIGVGPGRFAAELGVAVGIDPARAPLAMAGQRIAGVCQGVGEDLPLRPAMVGSLFILFTLCFAAQPERVLAEAELVLQPGGHLVLGVIPASGPWGQALAAKKQAGHPFYQYATFYEIREIEGWLGAAGLEVVERRSSLYQGPKNLTAFESSRPGWTRDAGFVVLVARKG